MFDLQPPRHIYFTRCIICRVAAIRPQLEHKPTWRGHRECAACNVTPRLSAAARATNPAAWRYFAAIRRAGNARPAL